MEYTIKQNTGPAIVRCHQSLPSTRASFQLQKHTTRDEGPIQDNSQACGRRERGKD